MWYEPSRRLTRCLAGGLDAIKRCDSVPEESLRDLVGEMKHGAGFRATNNVTRKVKREAAAERPSVDTLALVAAFGNTYGTQKQHYDPPRATLSVAATGSDEASRSIRPKNAAAASPQ